MLVKINSIDEFQHKVNVTILDIDDYGSVIPLKDVEVNLPVTDKSLLEILKNSSYAAIFTEENNSTVVLANGISLEELDEEKRKTIDATTRR